MHVHSGASAYTFKWTYGDRSFSYYCLALSIPETKHALSVKTSNIKKTLQTCMLRRIIKLLVYYHVLLAVSLFSLTTYPLPRKSKVISAGEDHRFKKDKARYLKRPHCSPQMFITQKDSIGSKWPERLNNRLTPRQMGRRRSVQEFIWNVHDKTYTSISLPDIIEISFSPRFCFFPRKFQKKKMNKYRDANTFQNHKATNMSRACHFVHSPQAIPPMSIDAIPWQKFSSSKFVLFPMEFQKITLMRHACFPVSMTIKLLTRQGLYFSSFSEFFTFPKINLSVRKIYLPFE